MSVNYTNKVNKMNIDDSVYKAYHLTSQHNLSNEQLVGCSRYVMNHPSLETIDLVPTLNWIISDYTPFKFHDHRDYFINRDVRHTEGMYLVVISPNRYLTYKHTSVGLCLTTDNLRGTNVFGTLVDTDDHLEHFFEGYQYMSVLPIKPLGCCDLINLGHQYNDAVIVPPTTNFSLYGNLMKSCVNINVTAKVKE